MELSLDQQKASDEFMQFMVNPNERFMIIRGNAGSGKSTLTADILRRVKKEIRMLSLLIGKTSDSDLDIFITAPTNKAARVIADITSVDPLTIHSLLGLRVLNDFKTGGSKLVQTKDYQMCENSLLLVDEASYVDDYLLDAIDRATPGCKVLFIGDPDQLSLGADTKLPVFDMDVRTVNLTTNNRNKGPISDLALKYKDAIQHGLFPKIVPVLGFVDHVDGPTFKKLMDTEFLNSSDIDHAKVLAWTNSRVHQYNDYIRDLLGLPSVLTKNELVITNKPIIKSPSNSLSLATDSVCQITSITSCNDQYGVTGNMVQLNNSRQRLFLPENQNKVTSLLKVLSNDKNWKDYFNIKNNWLDLRPLHSSTVHKSQGSTYNVVFIDLDDIGKNTNANSMARILYVATSRAKTRVVFYGDLPKKHYGKVL